MIDRLHEALSAELNVAETLKWFNQHYLPVVLERMNDVGFRKTMALYDGERLRTNERNLTDTRTRLGLLLEDGFARISNEILADEGIDDLFWNYVVANRFPDLEVHSNNGSTLMRIEMKALEVRAEEKSANFATLIKDINPETDYLVVCLWEWDSDINESIEWDAAVKVHKVYVFHAYSLARIRDCYWLNNPPSCCREQSEGAKRYQGIDIRTAINCTKQHYSVEEHNMGKILRLWQGDAGDLPDSYSEIERETLSSYLEFVDEVYRAGFDILSSEILRSIGGANIEFHSISGIRYPESNGVAIVPKEIATTNNNRERIARDSGARIVIKMNKNYQCSASPTQLAGEYDAGPFNKVKPKHVAQMLKDMGPLWEKDKME